MAKSVVIKIGLGRSKSGKILDKDTKWFTSDKLSAIEYHRKTRKPIFIKVGSSAYKEITLEQLVTM